jgi:hypothetical protein
LRYGAYGKSKKISVKCGPYAGAIRHSFRGDVVAKREKQQQKIGPGSK